MQHYLNWWCPYVGHHTKLLCHQNENWIWLTTPTIASEKLPFYSIDRILSEVSCICMMFLCDHTKPCYKSMFHKCLTPNSQRRDWILVIIFAVDELLPKQQVLIFQNSGWTYVIGKSLCLSFEQLPYWISMLMIDDWMFVSKISPMMSTEIDVILWPTNEYD